ncbi:transposable element Tcb1 transposase [Trichonephila clavipes]|nr:transposable element Tcb1 transposase [Trichonephila clavipes]
MTRKKQRVAIDQVSEFDIELVCSVVAYRDCGLSFREINSRVGRNQATVMRICDRWMQEGTSDRLGRSHPPQCTASREDRQIGCMAVRDHSVASRTVAQHIESVTHHSVSARTIRRRLQQSGMSARCPLLGLPLHRTTDVSTAQGAMKRCGGQNGMKLSLLTSYASVCNTTMVGFESGNTGREDTEQLCYAPPHWFCIWYYDMGRYCISLSHSTSTHSRYFKQPALHLRGVGASSPSLPSGLGRSHISTG